MASGRGNEIENGCQGKGAPLSHSRVEMLPAPQDPLALARIADPLYPKSPPQLEHLPKKGVAVKESCDGILLLSSRLVSNLLTSAIPFVCFNISFRSISLPICKQPNEVSFPL